MSALRITLDISDEVSQGLRQFAAGLEDKKLLHDRIAGDAEAFVKTRGAATAATEHRTANSLGAKPTGHLEDAYQGIESISDADSATLLIPGASRLRAAFGQYVLTPKNGSKFLTIPVARDSYGRRAREFDDLFPVRVGPKRTLVLARRQERTETSGFNRSKGKRYDNSKPLEVLYILTPSTTIKEDKKLIPFDELADEALDSTEQYLSELRKASLE